MDDIIHKNFELVWKQLAEELNKSLTEKERSLWIMGIENGMNVENENPKKLFTHKFLAKFSTDYVFDAPHEEGKKFVSNFNSWITTCVLHPLNTAKWFIGCSVKNPHDLNKPLVGFKNAFNRAVEDAWYAEESGIDEEKYKAHFWEAFLKVDWKNGMNVEPTIIKVKLPYEAKK